MTDMPKLYRRTKRGRKVGNWFVRIAGEEVNLQTKNAQEALRRRELAVTGGVRDFDDDAGTAAADTIDTLEAAPSAPPPAPAAAPAPAPPAPPAPAPPAPGALQPPPLSPDGYAPPPQPVEDWADAANGAAAGPEASSGGAAGARTGPGASTPPPMFDAGLVDAALGQMAAILVELQLAGQAWLIKRTAKVEPGTPPPAFPVKAAAVDAWKKQLLLWMPTDIEIQPWMLAVGLVGMCAPVQLATGTPIKKPDTEPSSAPAANDNAADEPQAAAA